MGSTIVGAIISWMLGLVTKLHEKHLAAKAAKIDIANRGAAASEAAKINDAGTAEIQAAETKTDESVDTINARDADSHNDSDIAASLRQDNETVGADIAAANRVPVPPAPSKPATTPRYFSS